MTRDTATDSNGVCANGSSFAQTTRNAAWYRGITRDGSTGTYQMGTRTYDPDTGAFTTPDTYRVATPSTDLSINTDPLTANTYTYVNGNPLNMTDPDGHGAVDPWGNDVSTCVSNPNAKSCSAEGVAAETAAYTKLVQSQIKASNKAAKKAAKEALAANPPPQVDSCVFTGDCLTDLEQLSITQGMAGTDCEQTAVPAACLEHGGSGDAGASSMTPMAVAGQLYDFFIGAAIDACKNFSAVCLLEAAAIVFKPLKGTRHVDDLGRLAAKTRHADERVNAALNSWAASGGSRIAANQAAGDAARDRLLSAYPGALPEQSITTTAGVRRLDILTPALVGIESKVGRTSLTAVTRSQIAKDSLLLQNGDVNGIEWVFSRSSVTGKIGPTGPLADALRKAGIPWSVAP